MNWADYSGSEKEEEEIPKEHSQEKESSGNQQRTPYAPQGGKKRNGNREKRPRPKGQSCLLRR